jgi:hypothetical protein
MPALTCRYTDRVNGDASASLARGLATTATRGSIVGTYDDSSDPGRGRPRG